MIAKKPISLGMTTSIAIEALNTFLNNPSVKEKLEKRFSEISARILTPEGFDIHWNEFFKLITG